MKNVREMTVQELIDNGANVDIAFYGNLETNSIQAEEKMMEYSSNYIHLEWERNAMFKSEISKRLSIRTFYLKDNDHNTESARARLTEYERKMKEAGHAERDFI